MTIYQSTKDIKAEILAMIGKEHRRGVSVRSRHVGAGYTDIKNKFHPGRRRKVDLWFNAGAAQALLLHQARLAEQGVQLQFYGFMDRRGRIWKEITHAKATITR